MREVVRGVMKQRGWTVIGLADQLGIPRPSLHRALSEERSPKSALRRRVIAGALQLEESEVWPD